LQKAAITERAIKKGQGHMEQPQHSYPLCSADDSRSSHSATNANGPDFWSLYKKKERFSNPTYMIPNTLTHSRNSPFPTITKNKKGDHYD